MSKEREQIATRVHSMYLPNDPTCSYDAKDWAIAGEIKQLQAKVKELEHAESLKNYYHEVTADRNAACDKYKARIKQLEHPWIKITPETMPEEEAIIDVLYKRTNVRSKFSWTNDKFDKHHLADQFSYWKPEILLPKEAKDEIKHCYHRKKITCPLDKLCDGCRHLPRAKDIWEAKDAKA